MHLDLKYLIPNKDTRQKGNVLSTGAALQGSTKTEVPWHNIYSGRDEGTHTQMWSHSHWQILTDPFHHGSHASLSLHCYHSSATCLCLTAHLTQTKHPCLHKVSPTACPALQGACHRPQLSSGAVPQKITSLETPQILKLPCRHEPPSSRVWTPREQLTLHSQTGTGTSSPTEPVPDRARSCTGQGSTI